MGKPKNKPHDMLSDGELLRYARQILLDEWDLDAQIHLKNTKVLIVGAGGLGCPVAQILARAGVGCIHLIDHDVIDDSNLQRQVLFDEAHVGQYKAEVAKHRLTQQNHFIDIHAHLIKLTDDNVGEVLQLTDFDLVIDCTDNFMVRDLINRACIESDVWLLSNSAIAQVGQIALFNRQIGCYHCVFGGQMGDERAGDENNCTNSGVLASTVSIIGSMTAQIALDVLGCGHYPVKGQLLLWQGRQMNLRKLTFDKNKDCPVCGKY